MTVSLGFFRIGLMAVLLGPVSASAATKATPASSSNSSA